MLSALSSWRVMVGGSNVLWNSRIEGSMSPEVAFLWLVGLCLWPQLAHFSDSEILGWLWRGLFSPRIMVTLWVIPLNLTFLGGYKFLGQELHLFLSPDYPDTESKDLSAIRKNISWHILTQNTSSLGAGSWSGCLFTHPVAVIRVKTCIPSEVDYNGN